jgi:hypothetical protein
MAKKRREPPSMKPGVFPVKLAEVFQLSNYTPEESSARNLTNGNYNQKRLLRNTWRKKIRFGG